MVLVRDGGTGVGKHDSPIVQFITGATLRDTGGSTAAIRTSDE